MIFKLILSIVFISLEPLGYNESYEHRIVFHLLFKSDSFILRINQNYGIISKVFCLTFGVYATSKSILIC